MVSNHRFLIALALIFASLTTIYAEDKDDIEDMFLAYMQCYLDGDYYKASSFIQPTDIEAFKTVLLTVLLKSYSTTNQNNKATIEAILGNNFGKTFEEISAGDFFASFMDYVVSISSGLKDALKVTTVAVSNIYYKDDNDHAIIEYDLLIYESKTHDMDSAVRIDGKWYLQMKSGIETYAEIFEKAFN